MANTANPLRVAAVPDSFKGSATAAEVAAGIEAGVRAACDNAGRPVEITAVPFADGGEGTLQALLSAWGEEARSVPTVDALGRPVSARFGISPDGRLGVIEAAESNGLPLIDDAEFEPMRAGTRGVAALVEAVLDRGVSEILLCIGGSATTDAGAGLLAGLGARLLDADGEELPDGGGALAQLDRIDLAGLDQRLHRISWRVACDVTNPLLGPRGAAAVFGPQKGADEDQVRQLDDALDRFARILLDDPESVIDKPGMGAAGGMPLVLHGVLGAELLPGAELVADVLDLRPTLAAADLVITGEGRLDEQSLNGKVIDTIRRLTPATTPVLVLAGEVALDAAQLADRGLIAFSIAPGPRTLSELRSETDDQLRRVAQSVTAVFLSGAHRSPPTETTESPA
ncbi:glycerate kinase [Naumannella halotolerans]|uniref:glycerate kinase n=1 Tax=Naumannella halotolerans TaxID=993414 RepID=UPI00370D3E31